MIFAELYFRFLSIEEIKSMIICSVLNVNEHNPQALADILVTFQFEDAVLFMFLGLDAAETIVLQQAVYVRRRIEVNRILKNLVPHFLLVVDVLVNFPIQLLCRVELLLTVENSIIGKFTALLFSAVSNKTVLVVNEVDRLFFKILTLVTNNCFSHIYLLSNASLISLSTIFAPLPCDHIE